MECPGCREKEEMVAAILAFSIDFEDVTDEAVPKKCMEMWKKSVNAMHSQEPWKDGKHMGDCTKQANTCMRCFVEKYRKIAEETCNGRLFV